MGGRRFAVRDGLVDCGLRAGEILGLEFLLGDESVLGRCAAIGRDVGLGLLQRLGCIAGVGIAPGQHLVVVLGQAARQSAGGLGFLDGADAALMVLDGAVAAGGDADLLDRSTLLGARGVRRRGVCLGERLAPVA